jgi:hypothetical protein
MVTQRKNSMLVATFTIMALILAACTSARDDTQAAGGSGPTSTSVLTPTDPYELAIGDPLAPGRYAFDTGLYAYSITMDIPRGWGGNEGQVITKGDGQGIGMWDARNVYADPCAWKGTMIDPPAGSSVDGLVAALAAQKDRHASKPTDVTLDGFSGTYMELTTPAGIHLADCDDGQFRSWNGRWTEPGQRDMLWIVDVDGDPLVIDAALGDGTSAQDRAERTKIVESTQIDPA